MFQKETAQPQLNGNSEPDGCRNELKWRLQVKVWFDYTQKKKKRRNILIELLLTAVMPLERPYLDVPSSGPAGNGLNSKCNSNLMTKSSAFLFL